MDPLVGHPALRKSCNSKLTPHYPEPLANQTQPLAKGWRLKRRGSVAEPLRARQSAPLQIAHTVRPGRGIRHQIACFAGFGAATAAVASGPGGKRTRRERGHCASDAPSCAPGGPQAGASMRGRRRLRSCRALRPIPLQPRPQRATTAER
ncbi:hypothetical protein LG3211_3610 [Lysobacter gummosus]|nr:hypothetical protein LG3211_3610 [Lysobacter gummosus]